MTYRDLWLGAGLAVLSALLYLVLIPVGIKIPSGMRSPVMSPAFWPTIISWFLFAVSSILFIRAALAWRRGQIVSHKSADIEGEEERSGTPGLVRALAVITLLFVYYWLILKIGMVPASMAAMLVAGLITARPKLWLLIIATPVLPMLLYLFFYRIANVPIPGGEWLVFP